MYANQMELPGFLQIKDVSLLAQVNNTLISLPIHVRIVKLVVILVQVKINVKLVILQ